MFAELLEKEMNVSKTENGALGYKTTGSALVDFNFKVSSFRTKNREKDIIPDFVKAWHENPELAIKYLFYLRDVREGLGERNTFRVILHDIADYLDTRVFDWIMKYGRADDLFLFFDTKLEWDMVEYVQQQLFKDMDNCIANKPISLLAKWMPSINTTSEDTRKLAYRFIKELNITPANYRKCLSKLRKYLDVVERKLCKNEWGKVDYNTVPSLANLKYNKAFFKHDEERRKAYLEALKNVDKTAKINASVLYPHDIVNKYKSFPSWSWQPKISDYDETLEQLWKNLPNYLKDEQNVLVIRDGSGSMGGAIGTSSKITAMDVADALSIYFSERCSGPYKDKFLTFSSKPQYVDLSKNEGLREKLVELTKYDECSNTNIEAVFDLVLKIAVENNLEQEDIPTLLIISDMEFDYAITDKSRKLFTVIGEKYKRAGYQLPKLVFWNVNSRTGTIPVIENDRGVILVSGFSAAITKMVLSNEADPYKALVEILNSDRYKEVTLNKETV